MGEQDELEIPVGDGCIVPRSLLTFKVLVYDTPGQNLIGVLMKVGNLRECNIVLN